MTMRDDIFDRLVADTQAAAPEWQPRPTDPVYAALDAVATVLSGAFLYVLARERAVFVQTSTKEDLILLAESRGVVVTQEQRSAVIAGDSAATLALRQRAIDALRQKEPSGNFDKIEADARSAPQATGFAVSQALAQPDYDTGRVTVYILRADEGETAGGAPLPGTPTSDMVRAVQNYITDRRRQAASARYTVSATTPITEYTITATVDHDGKNANVDKQVRDAIYAWIDDNRMMGRGIRLGTLYSAIYAVDGVVDVSITVPASDLTATGAADLIARTAFSCRKDATNVNLTFVLDPAG